MEPDSRGDLCFECPHCQCQIIVNVNDIHCGIFRHGAYPDGQPIDPHLNESSCIQLRTLPNIQGCIKPFRITKHDQNGTTYHINTCGYI
jgi:hypothetical protein